MPIEEILDAWRVNNAINLEILALCPDESFELKPGKGKTIRSNFVHMLVHRRGSVEEKLKKEAEAIPKLDWKTATRAEITDALNTSADLIGELIKKFDEKPGRWTAVKFLTYITAHEAHHRSQIEIALRLGGQEPPDEVLYRLWEWTKK
jgi:uncharacterized damage-inducible protein DinB